MNKKILLILLSFILMILVTCTAGPNNLMKVGSQGEVAGFWQGLWHELIAIVTFVISLFKDNVSVYEVHNNGAWYNFGFILGMMIILGGGCKGTCSHRK